MRQPRSVAVAFLATLLVSGCALGRRAVVAADPPSGERSAVIGEAARFEGLTLTPIAVVEDSRCPAGVQCIQAGTVRVTTQIIAGAVSELTVLRLGVPKAAGPGRTATLIGLCPAPDVRPRVLPPAMLAVYAVAPLGAAAPAVQPLDCPASPPKPRRRTIFG